MSHRPLKKARASPMPEPQWVKPAWVALVEILRRIEEQPYHWPVRRTTFQKIAYVVTEDEPETALAIRNLAALSWLKVKPSRNLPLPDEAEPDV